MNEIVGRAGFHVEHTKNVAERGAILHEMMRELDEQSIRYWAERNPNIVVADEALNEAYVNDGDGGFRTCTDRQEVLDYGDERIARVKRKFVEDRPTLNKKTGKTEMKGGTATTTLIVMHLPKSMCVEVPNYYPVLDSKTGQPVVGTDGTPLMRSRWVARDRDEARRYFMDALSFLEDHVIPGGRDGVHGIDIQHSESTPHIQILADTFGVDPKDADALRVMTSQAWFAHRDVLDAQGRQKSGKTKMSEYHAGLKGALIERGYDISPDFDEERHMVGHTKDDYALVQDRKRRNAEHTARNARDHDKLNEWDARLLAERHKLEDDAAAIHAQRAALQSREAELQTREDALQAGEAELVTQRAQLPRLRRQAAAEGREAGRAAGLREGREAAESVTMPALFNAFLDKRLRDGGTIRSERFEPFVDEQLAKVEHELGVTGEVIYDADDREQFINDGGEQLRADIAQQQRDRQLGE